MKIEIIKQSPTGEVRGRAPSGDRDTCVQTTTRWPCLLQRSELLGFCLECIEKKKGVLARLIHVFKILPEDVIKRETSSAQPRTTLPYLRLPP